MSDLSRASATALKRLTTNEAQGLSIHITGIVQGVGFRPFVYGLAVRTGLSGWVRNTSSGVDIEVDGPAAALDGFTAALRNELPPLARIDSLVATPRPADGFTGFNILASQAQEGAFQPISPDMAICSDCRRELFDPADRRYRYPFINCTNCGPRFTIIRDIPYDRPLTTMAPFPLCSDCAAEYHNPLDRRFHAQPVACPACGPRVWLERPGETAELAGGDHALAAARALLGKGAILAVKGLGGFHLACDATNDAAVATLRRRKLRVDKPFAVMLPDLDAVRRHCLLSETEAALLSSPGRPIVIVPRHLDSTIAAAVAPGQTTIGVMLPYTPLHYLLLERAAGFTEALVMTSGNLSEEPIAYSNEAARERLGALADAFLLHNRDIYTRCDDSVVRVVKKRETTDFTDDTDLEAAGENGARAIKAPVARASHTLPLRRSRGYAPYPVRLPWSAAPLLATGAELKNTFCLTRDDYAFLSHHIGDLENYETLVAFLDGVTHMERLFRARPQAIAYDLHPNYLATRYAQERAEREGLPAIGVQHHHAHIAAGMAEHGLPPDAAVIGVAFDGTGYGDDGAIWGGEFLVGGYGGYERAAHLRYSLLPGGDRAVRGKLGAFRLGRRNHSAFVRLRRNNGHHGHAGFLSATGAHFVNPVIELGNLGIKRIYALLQRTQSLVGLAQQLLVGFAGRFHLTHFVRRSAASNQRNAGQRHNNQCFHPGLQHKSILALKYRSMHQKPATDAHQKNFGPVLSLARLLKPPELQTHKPINLPTFLVPQPRPYFKNSCSGSVFQARTGLLTLVQHNR